MNKLDEMDTIIEKANRYGIAKTPQQNKLVRDFEEAKSTSGRMKISFESSCLGRMRSTGDIILMLLELDKEQAHQILADVIKSAGMNIDEVVCWYYGKTCPDCGVSLILHENGLCP